jgi:putative spermidine/putrescine transport system ATP-binding protein
MNTAPAQRAVPTSGAPYVRIDRLTKHFGDFVAVRQVSLEIARGEIFCLLGGSGCGKTTLLRMLAGFEAPTEGSIFIDGVDVTQVPPYERPVNMMFQSYALFPHLTVLDNVAFALKMRGIDRTTRHKRAGELLELVAMSQYAARLPAQLSGGQQQRVALARALITEPQILLLDEPLSALDPFLRVKMRGELKRLQRELGISFIQVTHGQEEAMALADHIVVMNQGKIEQQGSARDIFHHPRTEFVARFIGGHNVLSDAGSLIAVRADQLGIVPFVDGAYGAPALLTQTEYQGSYVAVSLTLDDGTALFSHVPESTFDVHPFRPGDRVLVTWDPAKAQRLQ